MTTTLSRTSLALALALPPTACSDPGDSTAPNQPVAGETEQPPETTTDGERDWEELIAGEWQLDPGKEAYRCIRVTLDEDWVIGALRPLTPFGTHHTTLTVEEPANNDGVTECDGAAGAFSERGIYGSGVNTKAFPLPDGVGMLLRAGEQLLLNLHLFNTTSEPISGRSGMEILRRPAEEIDHWAGSTLMGPLDISLPPQQETRISGGCTLAQQVTAFGILPHMHQLGSHMKVTARRAGQPDEVIWDDSYDFQEQLTYPLSEFSLSAGDRIEVDCTYVNDTDATVGFGDSSTEEMCFAGLMMYPDLGQPVCAQ